VLRLQSHLHRRAVERNLFDEILRHFLGIPLLIPTSMNPGAIALTVMFWRANSGQKLRERNNCRLLDE